ncbi:MAG: lysophospholipid acyltransferase family protein [Alphaproteobacteria bacterium]|nr:lysophospholipid acyltransferase family protein [Alphaproteobacteria bacterium]
MDWTNRVLRRDDVRRFLCWLVSLYIRLVRLTGAWITDGGAVPAEFHAGKRPFILAFWHGRLLMMPCAWERRVPIHMLISGHRDGRIIADAVRHFGIDSIAGSTTSGGSGALRAMVRHLKDGECVGITPDGPDGPAMRASSGIVAVARLAGAPVVPLAYATRRRRILDTWDRFHLPLPCSRGTFIWGEPIVIPPELDDAGIERYRALIEQRLNAITAEADRRVGRERVSPGTQSRQALRRMQRQNGHG